MLTAFNASMSVIKMKHISCSRCVSSAAQQLKLIEPEIHNQLHRACLQQLSGFALCSVQCMLMGRAMHVDWVHAHGIVTLATYHNVCS